MSLSICCYNENNIKTKRRSDHEISHEVRRDALAAFMTDSIWDKNSSVRYAEKELSHKRRELKRGSGV